MSQLLISYDDILRSSLEEILNINLTDSSWNQATLPTNMGGLGIRSATEVALPAFLASLHGTRSTVNALLPNFAFTDPLIDIANSKWTNESIPEIPLRSQQKTWDAVLYNAKANAILHSATSPTERARLLATRSPHANDWLEAIPAPQLGLKLNDTQVRLTVALQLGASICHPHTCVCGLQTDRFGHHGLSCNKNGGRYSRHNEANDTIKRALQTALIPSILEPSGLDRDDGRRPDGVTLCPWKRGKQAVWDFTCSDTLATSNIPRTSMEAGSAATEAETRKKSKYTHLSNDYLMIPVGAETLGGWGPSATSFLNSIGKRLFRATGEARSTQFLYQRLSVAIKRGNATAILSCLPQGKGMEEIFRL